MKCLEKDRTRRYETASGLARDVEHYLADEPVEAGPPGAGYRLRKCAAQVSHAAAGGGRVPAALVVGAVASTWQAIRATVAEQSGPVERAGGQKRKDEADEAKQLAEQRRDELAARQRQPPPGQLRRRHEPRPRRLGREQPGPRPRAAREAPAPARRDRPARLRMALPPPPLPGRSADRQGACRPSLGRRLHAGRQATGHFRNFRIEPANAEGVPT